MAPRTRSNRVEMLARQKFLASGQTFNTTGFAALPDELYLEIISHFPAYPIPLGEKSVKNRAVRDRHLTLFALSQTCRSLRPAFLRYLWQRIEVYDGMETGSGELRRRYGVRASMNKKYAEELVRQLEVVTVREPSFARHVNFINVLVTEYSVDTVLAELARCIALFPNLHTVQLDFRFSLHKRRHLWDTFKAYQYPSIRNVFVSPVSVMFLRACPEARFVAPLKWQASVCWPRPVLEKIFKRCPALEVLGPFYFEKGDVQSIARRLPKLREITLHHITLKTRFEFLHDLSKLRHLSIINIKLAKPPHWLPNEAEAEAAEWLRWAKKILSQVASTAEDNREPRKVVVHLNGVSQTYFVNLR